VSKDCPRRAGNTLARTADTSRAPSGVVLNRSWTPQATVRSQRRSAHRWSCDAVQRWRCQAGMAPPVGINVGWWPRTRWTSPVHGPVQVWMGLPAQRFKLPCASHPIAAPTRAKSWTNPPLPESPSCESSAEQSILLPSGRAVALLICLHRLSCRKRINIAQGQHKGGTSQITKLCWGNVCDRRPTNTTASHPTATSPSLLNAPKGSFRSIVTKDPRQASPEHLGYLLPVNIQGSRKATLADTAHDRT
jgi:hypothetical protein